MLSLVVAKSKNDVIGFEGKTPWRLADDLKIFKRLTTGHTVIMGRKTYDAIKLKLGGPLPNRQNIILSHKKNNDSNVTWAKSPDRALKLIEHQQVFIIGGEEIYKLFIDQCRYLYISEVDAEVEGDTYFPKLNLNKFREISRKHYPADKNNQFAFDFVVYERELISNISCV